MSNQTLLFQVVAVGAIAGAAAIMTFRKPNMRSWAYIRRSLLALLWAWGILAVAVCQIWRAGTGGWPDAEVFHPFAPGAALIGFLLVGLFILGHALDPLMDRLKRPNHTSEGSTRPSR